MRDALGGGEVLLFSNMCAQYVRNTSPSWLLSLRSSLASPSSKPLTGSILASDILVSLSLRSSSVSSTRGCAREEGAAAAAAEALLAAAAADAEEDEAADIVCLCVCLCVLCVCVWVQRK